MKRAAWAVEAVPVAVPLNPPVVPVEALAAARRNLQVVAPAVPVAVPLNLPAALAVVLRSLAVQNRPHSLSRRNRPQAVAVPRHLFPLRSLTLEPTPPAAAHLETVTTASTPSQRLLRLWRTTCPARKLPKKFYSTNTT